MPGYEDVELAVALNLTFKPLEQIALEFCDLAAAQARHMNVIALRPPFIKVLFTLHVHQIEFVYQAIALQQT